MVEEKKANRKKILATKQMRKRRADYFYELDAASKVQKKRWLGAPVSALPRF